MPSLTSVLADAASLSIQDQLALNKALVALIKGTRRAAAAVASTQFQVGQLIKFTKSGAGRHAGLHYVRVNGFNRAGTCIVGPECDAKGEKIPGAPRWTVYTTSCTLTDIA